MKKIIFYSTVLPLSVIALIVGVLFYRGAANGINDNMYGDPLKNDLKSFRVEISGQPFYLVDGKAENMYRIEGTETKNTLTIFQEPVTGDLDGDGDMDGAILLVNNPGGSGTFYYAVLVMNNAGKYDATNVLLLGDRIAPQTIEIHDGRAVFNYAERKASEPMTTPPSMGKSLWIHFDKKSGEIGEWVKDFEGEADPARMTLGMKKWMWVKTIDSKGSTITPKIADKFGLTFSKDGNVAVSTDCNSMGGKYTSKDGALSFGNMFSTMMYCEGSQEQEFSQTLQVVTKFEFTSKGELLLRSDGNTMFFR